MRSSRRDSDTPSSRVARAPCLFALLGVLPPASPATGVGPAANLAGKHKAIQRSIGIVAGYLVHQGFAGDGLAEQAVIGGQHFVGS